MDLALEDFIKRFVDVARPHDSRRHEGISEGEANTTTMKVFVYGSTVTWVVRSALDE